MRDANRIHSEGSIRRGRTGKAMISHVSHNIFNINGQMVRFKPKEAEILRALASRIGREVAHETIMQAAGIAHKQTIKTHISFLRPLLHQHGYVINSCPYFGYMLKEVDPQNKKER